MYIREIRKSNYEVNDLFLNRWSPRAMSGESLAKEEIMPLFEAARWAPSSYNGQPWYFLYAMRDTPEWDKFFSLLVDFNQQWCKNASVLLVMISRKHFEQSEKPNPCHTFDTGAAWQNLALQASLRGLVCHGMAGFDDKKARELLNIPGEFNVEAMAAIGKPGNKEKLPETIREKEKPSSRKPVSEFTREGGF